MKRKLVVANDDVNQKFFRPKEHAVSYEASTSTSEPTVPSLESIQPTTGAGECGSSSKGSKRKCPECGEMKSKDKFYIHLFDSHGYDKDCPKKMKSMFTKESRERRMTLREKNDAMNDPQCNKWNAKFPNMSRLERHLSTCSGKRILSCPFCSCICRSQKGLILHCRSEHLEDPEAYEVDTIEFDQEKEFQEWKWAAEESSATSFVIAGTTRLKNDGYRRERRHVALHSFI
ncbi:hypothetical protein ANCCAN_07139 [Ancylostoma caninum]|uniref:C2H2-type domain-containing protein n=1 Tax=Ancylostoma caninum TaxID=29170 RepID=A0A368GV03_ANCCA|nr:hypothetical protein ANCCAN_07139 [Ancylostoma caninum]